MVEAGWEFGELGTTFGDHWWRVERVEGDTAFIKLVHSSRFKDLSEWPVIPLARRTFDK